MNYLNINTFCGYSYSTLREIFEIFSCLIPVLNISTYRNGLVTQNICSITRVLSDADGFKGDEEKSFCYFKNI